MNIAVLVSGGVDSAVALHMLKAQGHTVTAFYLKIWLEDELAYLGDCPWEQDLAYVRAVCESLDVPLRVVPLQKEYWDRIVTYTIDEIKAGRTPNPDVLCNARIKFGAFLDAIDDSFDRVASGHYARVAETDGMATLHMAPDAIKDQTYFLAHMSQEQLKRVIFPLGHMAKTDVRAYAELHDLPNKDRKDSQGICFLGKLKFRDFIKHYLGEKPGSLVELETGTVLGEHKGFWFYTIGQRQGIGLAGGPWYVVQKDTKNNVVYVSRHYYDDDKKRDSFTIDSCSWFAGTAPAQKELLVKIRHGAHMHVCTVTPKGSQMHVKLATNDQGISPGQFAVFYDGTHCLGSGIISE